MSKVTELMIAFEDEDLIDEVEQELEGGVEPSAIIADLQEGMVVIGNKFSEGDLFVSDLMMAGAMFKEVSKILAPHIKSGADSEGAGKVVIGTVKDDIHDIGKDIVCNMLSASGFDVIDLGVDVEPEHFVSAVKESGAKVVGLSCLLASCYDSILDTVNAFADAGMRDDVKIIIGGGPIDEHVVEYAGADAMGGGAQDTVDYCKGVYA